MRKFQIIMTLCLSFSSSFAVAQDKVKLSEPSAKEMVFFSDGTRTQVFLDALRVELAGRNMQVRVQNSPPGLELQQIKQLSEQFEAKAAFFVGIVAEHDALGLSDKPSVYVYDRSKSTGQQSQMSDNLDTIEARIFALTVVSLLDELGDSSRPQIVKTTVLTHKEKPATELPEQRKTDISPLPSTLTYQEPSSFVGMSAAFAVGKKDWFGAGIDAVVSLPFFDFFY
ncbi:MAG: hypothetical protein IPJ88_02400 [Myxococcales bacterium]|nr:MAG: hypothetical protein IPJ88_02400 [Myxococcales bacterium]